MPTHKILSCHMIQVANFANFKLWPNTASDLISGEVTKFLVGKPSTSEIINQKLQCGGGSSVRVVSSSLRHHSRHQPATATTTTVYHHCHMIILCVMTSDFTRKIRGFLTMPILGYRSRGKVPRVQVWYYVIKCLRPNIGD